MAHSVMVIFFQENMQCNLTSITLMKAISIMYGLYMQLKIFKKINPTLTRPDKGHRRKQMKPYTKNLKIDGKKKFQGYFQGNR